MLLITGPNTAVNLPNSDRLGMMFPDVQSIMATLAMHEYHRAGHQDGAADAAEAATAALLQLLMKRARDWAGRWTPVGVLR